MIQRDGSLPSLLFSYGGETMTVSEGLLFFGRWVVIMAVIAVIGFGGTAIYRKCIAKKSKQKNEQSEGENVNL